MSSKTFVISFYLFFFLVIVSAQSEYTYASIPKELTQKANAVVRFELNKITLLSRNELTLSYKRVVTVLNKNGRRSVGAYAHYDDNSKITSIGAVIYDQSGNVIKKIKKKDFSDQSAVSGSTMYSDSRVLYMEYTPTSYPYTVEFDYEMETSNTVSVPNWMPMRTYYESVQECVYDLTYSEFLGIRVKEKNFEEFSKAMKIEKTAGKLRYTAKNLMAYKREVLSPDIEEMTPYLMVAANKFNADGILGEATNWKEFGKWMHDEILTGRDELPVETVEYIKNLVKGIEDPVEKAKIIYNYVQENTRYISVQVGIGGYQPISAIDVDKVKYGDCKGLTNYTKSLLDQVGVESYYAHVESGRAKKDFDEDFASLIQGDHVILYIPNEQKDIWLDCTSQVHPFGFIGDFTDDRKVLIIKPDGGEIIKTTSYLNEENYQNTTAVYSLSEDGSLKGEVTVLTRGVTFDNRFFLNDASQRNKEEHYKDYWGNINNLKLENIHLSMDEGNVTFTEKIKLSAPGYSSVSGDRILFTPNAFNKNSFVPKRYRNRKMPLQINRGFMNEDEFIVNLPDGYTIEAIPDSSKLENKFGEYEVSYEQDENGKIVYKRKLLIKEGEFPKEDYNAYRDFRKQINRLDNAKVVLIKK